MALIDTNPFRAANTADAKYPKLNAIKKDPLTKAVLDKLIQESGTRKGWSKAKNAPPAEGLAARVSDQTTRNITDTNNIFQLLPDTELAMQILVSSILSPKDMVNIELGFRVDNTVLDGEAAGMMLETVRRYFEEIYKMKALLPKILEECLFTKGSYPILVLPESSLDDIINGDTRISVEALRTELGSDSRPRKSIGLLGSANKPTDFWSLEAFNGMPKRLSDSECELTVIHSLSSMTVSDNLNTLKFPSVIAKFRQERIADTLGRAGLGVESGLTVNIPQGFIGAVSSPSEPKNGGGQVQVGSARAWAQKKALVPFKKPVEQREKVTDDDLAAHFYKPRNYTSKPFLSVKPLSVLEKKTVGHPVVIKLPPESVIPVHVPSNPEDHIGYFVLLDTFGNPLNRVREADYYRDLASNITSTDVSSQLLDSGRRAATGFNQHDRTLTEAETVRLYADIVEQDLLARLRNGVYGESVEIARPLDVYRVMLARALANRGTQILYVPAELVTYIAFDYNSYGVGKSLLEDNKILASIRAMLLFSSTMSAIKNSTGKTSVKIELDPDDPDPASTVEYMIHEYSRNRQATYPLGASNPIDIIDFLQNAGIDVQVSGNSAYPETRLMVEDHSSSKVEVDSKLEEDIKRKYFMSLGLSPETIDMTSNIEFATSIVTSNLLLAKRVMLYQETLLRFLKDFIRKYVVNSSKLWGSLLKTATSQGSGITANHKELGPEGIVDLFLDALEVTLPKPDSAKLANQLEAYTAYNDALEKAIDAYFGADSFMLKDFDDVEESISAVRAAVIAHYQREWLRNNNVLPELMDLVQQDEDGKPIFDLAKIHGTHLEQIGLSITALIEKLRKDREARVAVLGEPEETGDSFGDSGGGDDEFGGGEGDEFGDLDAGAEGEEGEAEEVEGTEETEETEENGVEEEEKPEAEEPEEK